VRVAIVTESFLPVVNGVSNSVVQVLRHLRGTGHTTLLVAPGDGPDTHDGTPVIRLPSVGLPVVDALPVGLPSKRITLALRDFRPDVVHLASPFVVGARAMSAARALGVPTVAVYQTDVAGFASSYGLGLTARVAWRWTRRIHAAAHRTLAPSTAAVDALRANGVPRVHLWPRGVDAARFTPARHDPAWRQRILGDGRLLVGYVGRLAREKHVHHLAALHDLPGVRLVIIGDGPQRAALRTALPAATFLGQLSGDELATAYASLDLFVHTGPHETFGQTIQEALASGTPVIAPASGGPRDLIAPGRTGYLVPAGDARALRACVSALDDPTVRATFGAAARRSVLRRTWSSVCDQLLHHYRAVTHHPVSTDQHRAS